jgi:hypothetical protein
MLFLNAVLEIAEIERIETFGWIVNHGFWKLN